MTTKLNPPYIEGKIPSCYGDTITVPYMMNSIVNKDSIIGFKIKVKSLISKNNNDFLFSTSELVKGTDLNTMMKNHEVKFNLTIPQKTELLRIGQYYKLQMAFLYKDDEDSNITKEGYYSTVGIFKWTTKPEVGIKGFEKGKINRASNVYIGTYTQKELKYEYEKNKEKYTVTFKPDSTEKVEKYRFRLFDSKENIVEDTGWQIHDSSSDSSSTESQDIFEYNKEIPSDEIYKIQYRIVTNNGLDLAMRYEISQDTEVKPQTIMTLNASNNEENGYVNLTLSCEKPVLGTFKILRRASNDKYGWEEITKIAFLGEDVNTWNWKDFSVEHNKEYIYAYQQYMDNSEGSQLFSKKIESNPVIAKFEHCFLWDGEKQLKINFNPKISSFKTVKMETKTETMGSKYPFFFRNGKISYKDFPISGLISYWSDDENLFATNDLLAFNDENDFDKVRTTNLTDLNFQRERNFKIRVLNWLNDGNVKLFKSPAEGNYLVRLMNVSLSPTDTVGRMLHTFSCNAYEIDSFSYNNLLKYGFLDLSEQKFEEKREITMYKTIGLDDCGSIINITPDGKEWKQVNLSGEIISLELEGFPSDFKFLIEIDDNLTANLKYSSTLPFKLPSSINWLYNIIDGAVQVGVDTNGSFIFNNLEGITSLFIPIDWIPENGSITYGYKKAFNNHFGTYESIENKIEVPIRQIYGDNLGGKNIIDYIEDCKTTINNVYYIRFFRIDQTINGLENNVYIGSDIKNVEQNSYIELREKNLKDLEISVASNILVEIGYSATIIEHIFEKDMQEKKAFNEIKNEFLKVLNGYRAIDWALIEPVYDDKYSILIKELDKKIEKYYEQGGIL